ncbi:Predicted dehydrogenase [Loktanella sp. DSM 29012]|uniref:Gfo/Idh/MocA family protein n=1 Tax=Loktanella sp. DSM 29012 TaxID=1881056 RepID=UPI0008C37831|nr:Gfo/Idh/MocA family oxidoreductase [Loktanella sp. DSM 29012]SEQ55307.1 Predicted dehydrogenase [Loktanella sp. DSM 29012]
MTMNIGLIGCGNISAAYLGLAPTFKDIRFVAVSDMNEEVALARAAEFGVKARTVTDLLASDDIDIIVNLTIPDAHYDVTKRILDAGKHAYTEKPLVLTLKQGKSLTDLAAAKGLRIGSAPDTFLGGAHQQARQIIDDGGIGRVTSGTAHFMGPGMEMWHPNPDFFFKPGGGPVLDMGPYYITNLVQLIGPVKRVGALATAAQTERTITSQPRAGETIPVQTPTTIHALLEFENGAAITLNVSWDVKAHRHANMELYGSDGTLFVPDPNHFGGALEQSDAAGTITEVPVWDHPFGRVNWELDGKNPRANYRTAGLADMAAAIEADRPHRCALDLAVHVTDVMTSILKSGETGKFIDMTTTCERPAALSPDDARALLADAP